MKTKILVADDEADIREVLKHMFEEDFDISLAADGQEVLDQIANSPDLIILDMHLPKVSGIEICGKVASMPPNERPAIIVLSGDTSDSLVKQAYEYGVSDYIEKPFNVVTFHKRIVQFSNDIAAITALRQKDEATENLAQIAMKQSAAYGRALELVAKLNDCNTVQDIMEAVANNLLNQDLKVAVQLRSDEETFSYDIDTQECSKIELQIFDVLKDHGRIYHFGRRSIFNDNRVSILFKNMPLEGTVAFDAILDVAAKLILAVNSRFISLQEHQALLLTREKLNSAMDMLSAGIDAVTSERRTLIENIELQIGLSFHALDMSEEQEQFFMKLIETELRSKGASEDLVKLREIIESCVNAMEFVESQSSNEQDAVVVSDLDVELF